MSLIKYLQVILKKVFLYYKFEIISLHLKTIELKISSKKTYNKPEVTKVSLDNSISLVMMTTMPPNPPPRPRGDGSKGGDGPFASPFGDKPFG